MSEAIDLTDLNNYADVDFETFKDFHNAMASGGSPSNSVSYWETLEREAREIGDASLESYARKKKNISSPGFQSPQVDFERQYSIPILLQSNT